MIGTVDKLKGSLEKIKSWSTKKKILVLIVVWALIFIPSAAVYTSMHRNTSFAFYPEDSSPMDVPQGDWDVVTYPEANTTKDRYVIDVDEGENVYFKWKANNYTSQVHVGQVNVYYNTSWNSSGIVRLDYVAGQSEGNNETWDGNKTFHHDGEVRYYFRADKSDLPRFFRRASVIIEGGNLYEDVRTGPPPLINFFFIPPTLLAPSVEFGGYFLSFYIYFISFVLLDTLMIYFLFREWGEDKAFLSSLLFLINPITFYSMFQDEGIITFTIILSLILVIKKRKKLGAVSIGLGSITKVWTGFLVPAQLFDWDIKLNKRIQHIIISALVAGSLISLFYFIWGPKSLWFITFYGGSASKSTLGGISVWATLSNTSYFSASMIKSKFILAFIGIVELIFLYIGYKKKWDIFLIFTVTLSFFLIMYPKIHWEYYLLVLPTFVFYAVRDKRVFAALLGILTFTSLSRGVRNLPSYPDGFTTNLAFLFSIIFTAFILYSIYLFIKDSKFRDIFETDRIEVKSISHTVKKKMKKLLPTEESLQHKTLKSGIWSFFSRGATRGLMMLKLMIVAILLSPKDIGLLGVALLTLATFEVFTKTGFKQSIIQNKNEIKDHLNTAWTALAVRGLALYGIVFFSAPFIADFFGEPRAELVIQVIGLVLIFRGFMNIGVVLFEKELEFHKRFLIDLSEVLPSFIITVVLAIILRNVWALVYGTIAGVFFMMVASFILHPYKPKFEFDLEKAREMFGFGKWIFGSSIVIFIATQGDDIFLGRVLGVISLGVYQLSYKISNTPATEITHVISRVTFPAYSKIQDNIDKLQKGLNRTLRTTLSLSIPISVAIFLFVPGLTHYIIGDKWIDIIWPARILAISGLIRSITATWGPFYKARGKPKYAFYKNVLRVIGIFSTIYWLTKFYGIVGTSFSVLIGQSLAFSFDRYFMRKLGPFKVELIDLLKHLRGLLISVVTASVLYIVLTPFVTSLVSFLLITGTASAVFIVTMFLTEKIHMNPVISEVKEIIKSM